MIDIRRENYIAAAIAWCVVEQHSDFEKGQSIEQLQHSLEHIFLAELDKELIEAALSILCDHGAVSPVSDKFTQQYYYFDASEMHNLIISMAENAESPFNKIQIFGYTWIQEAVENIANNYVSYSVSSPVETLSTVKTEISVPVEWGISVPASDRIVKINHNSPEFKQALQDIDALEETVRTNNTISINQFEEQDALLAELQAIKKIIKSNYVRTPTLEILATGTLIYLAEKFADEPIKVMAKALWKLLSTLFGFGV